MNDIPFGDIIVLAAVAAFILLRYRSMLGEQRGRDVTDAKRPQAEEMERIIQLPLKDVTPKPSADPLLLGDREIDPATRKVLEECQRLDADFTVSDFLEGAKAAFEMLITAYREGDRETLKMLLSKELFENFDKAITAEEKENKRTQGTVVAITKAELTEAKLKGSTATLSVQFVSDQIQVVRDKDNVIIEGDASHEVEIDDHWVFTRDLKSLNPNWTIIET